MIALSAQSDAHRKLSPLPACPGIAGRRPTRPYQRKQAAPHADLRPVISLAHQGHRVVNKLTGRHRQRNSQSKDERQAG